MIRTFILAVVSVAALGLSSTGGTPRAVAASPGPPGSAAQAVSAVPPGGWRVIEQFYHQRLQSTGVVGSSLLIVRDGAVLGSAIHGSQDLSTNRAVDADTIYHWASITKTLTGIAIMPLRDRGRLSLDDPIVKYVPELRQAHNPYGDMAQGTVRHMMTHSSGLRAGTWPWGGDQPWHPFEPTRWDQLVAMLPYTELMFAPGTKYSYSNPGVIFLGRIIELLSGEDFEVYVTKNVLMALGMHASFFDRAPYYLLPHRSHSYLRSDAGLIEARFDFDTGITVSNGGLNAPFGDMAKYLAFLAGGPITAPVVGSGGAVRLAPSAAPAATPTLTNDRFVGSALVPMLTNDQPLGSGAIRMLTNDQYDIVLKRESLEEMWVPQLPATDGEGTSGNSAQAGLSFFLERHAGIESWRTAAIRTGSFRTYICTGRPGPATSCRSTRTCRRRRWSRRAGAPAASTPNRGTSLSARSSRGSLPV